MMHRCISLFTLLLLPPSFHFFHFPLFFHPSPSLISLLASRLSLIPLPVSLVQALIIYLERYFLTPFLASAQFRELVQVTDVSSFFIFLFVFFT